MARFAAALPVVVLVAAFGAGLGATPDVGAASMVEEGRKLAFERRKGNCVACHIMAGATLAGTVGPPLLAMKARFPDKAKLRDRIWDATTLNPQSLMPPFGRHEILTDDEIDRIVEYIHSL